MIIAVKFCHEKIRTLIPDNFLKICEIGGICGFNFGIWAKTNQAGKTVVSIRKSQVYMPGIGGSHGFPALKSEGVSSTNSF
jgi:hypothetical protein